MSTQLCIAFPLAQQRASPSPIIPTAYHGATSPGLGFCTLTILSQFKRHSGSNASFNY